MKHLWILLLFWVSAASAGINTFDNKPFTIKLFAESPLYELPLEPLDTSLGSVDKVTYEPNVGTTEGISFSYWFIGFAYVTKVNEEKVTDDKGSTKYDDYRFTFFYENLILSLKYLNYSGFFVSNSEDVDPSLPASTPFIVRPDIEAEQYSASLFYISEPDKYSVEALVEQTERQESSGGSWLYSIAVSQLRLSADSAFIPAVAQSSFGADATLSDGDFTTATASAGYGYTWVSSNKKWYLGILGLLGGGLQTRTYTLDTGEEEGTKGAFKFDIRFSMGYNGDSFIVGLQSSVDGTTFETDTIKISSQIPNFQFFIGTRF